MAVNVDQVAFGLAEELLGCFCEALAASVGGAACRCSILPGAQVAADLCCDCGDGNGQAWVRVAEMWPTTAAWPQRVAQVERCPLNLWAVELEVGAYRCAAKVDNRGRFPSADRMTRDAEVILDDAAAMRRAVTCCFRDSEEGRRSARKLLVGAWRPLGPDGGCVGGQMSVTVSAYDCCPE
ncbi:hypothetical protein ABT352_23150 [Streptosporangium sp. NPDC000563]|uniref:hypothetical protein n=1 Tax=Streptosporangium sp. NPDC000563 TaxID=3154366 RepID=UPI0033232A78